MLYRRGGMPEEDELVLCTVTSVQHHSVFVKLDEYEKTGMIHISEVSPGRIRNIRDYVQEGKKVVCKVLRIDPVKGHIDLSLRRVTEMQKRKKTDEIKREQKSEKIVELVAKELKKENKEVYENVSSKIFEKYEYISECFDDIVSESVNLEKLGIDANTAKVLAEVVKDKIKPIEVQIKGKLDLVSYAPDGVDIIREALKKAEAVDENVVIKYIGAGKYGIIVTAPDYKEAEKLLEKSTKKALTIIEKAGGEGSFEREEK